MLNLYRKLRKHDEIGDNYWNRELVYVVFISLWILGCLILGTVLS